MSFWSRLFGGGRKKSTKPLATSAAPASPSPKPVIRSVPMGVSVFCGWQNPRAEHGAVPGVQCPAEFPWQALQTQDREPALGYYDEADLGVTRWRLVEMQKGGIDFCTYQVEWAHEHTQPTKVPPYRKKLASPLTMSHCADNHSPESPVKFCISLWDVAAGTEANFWNELKGYGWSAVEAEESWRWFARTVAARYMTKPNYFTIDGRPVLFRGNAQNLEFYHREFGLSPNRIVQVMREEVTAFTGKELYLVATATNPDDRPKLKGWGFDCLTEYLLHGNDWNHAMDIYKYWWTRDLKFCREQGLDYIVPATSGYDSEAWGNPEAQKHVPTPAQFTEHLRESRKLALDNADICRAVNAYAWNERGESRTPIEPSAQAYGGDAMLRAFKAAVT